MNTIVFPSYEEMCFQTAEEIIRLFNENPRRMLCIAAGNTSLGVFDCLIKACQEGRVSFEEAYFVAMDEWLGMNAATEDSCSNFLVKHFLNHVNFKKDHIRLWDGCTGDTQKECEEVERFIRENSVSGGIDFLILGMGMNGHLALNEPGVDLHRTAHICQLDSVTQKVGQKYFKEQAPLTGGITLGIENFRQAERTILMVDGAHKAEITQKLISAPEVTSQLPATAIREFPNASLYCDKAAASLCQL